MSKSKVFSENGKFWFSRAYAAQLLGTTKGKILLMAARGFLTAHPSIGPDWVAEADVNSLRHHPENYAIIKKQLRERALPERGVPMPASTKYVGEAPRSKGQVKGRIGHPLKDSPES